MARFIMALDQGTTSSRCILFDKDARPVSLARRELRQIYPHPGWVEQDPAEILSTQVDSAREAMEKAGATAADIAALGVANQRETTVV